MSARADFWSRRRAAVAAEEAEPPATPPGVESDLSDADAMVAFDLPDPDNLSLGDDIRGFMNAAVPDGLRRRALRKLWTLNPTLANLDGMVDYGGDFTDKATVVENLQTAYQVGKGMLRHVEEMARAAEEEAIVADAAGGAPDDEVVAVADTTPEPEPTADTFAHDPVAYEDDEPQDGVRPRRMSFAFEVAPA